jgi:hypothetical protein
VVTLLSSESPIVSPPSHRTTVNSNATSPDGHRSGWPVRRLLIIASIVAIGGAALGWAVTLLPSERTIVSPSSYSVSMDQYPGWRIVSATLDVERQTDGLVEIQSSIYSSGSAASPRQTTLIGSLSIELYGTGIAVIHCPEQDHCSSGPSEDSVILGFSATTSFFTQTAIIRDPSFGFTENNVTAIAQLPYIVMFENHSDPIDFLVLYGIPQANTYDWSEPPLNVSSNFAAWDETVPPNTYAQSIQGVELTGTNNAAQVTDDRNTFISGVLFGIVSAAALAAAQEALHLIFDSRRRDEAAADAAQS